MIKKIVAYTDHAGRQMVSLSLDFFPIISAGKMLLEGLIGKDLITGDELSDEQMALTVVTVVCGGLLSSSALMPDALYGLEEVTVASEQSIIEAEKLAKTTVSAEKQITKVHVVEQSAIKVEKAEKTAAELEVVEKYGASSGSSAYKGGNYSNINEGLNFSSKAAEHLGESARQVPVQTLQDVIKQGNAFPDPRGSSATMYYSQMYINEKMYNIEVLYDEVTNTVYHFEYARKAMGNLPAIKK